MQLEITTYLFIVVYYLISDLTLRSFVTKGMTIAMPMNATNALSGMKRDIQSVNSRTLAHWNLWIRLIVMSCVHIQCDLAIYLYLTKGIKMSR